MASKLADHIADFIKYKRKIGYDYKTGERYLNHYLSFMSKHYSQIELPEKTSTEEFLSTYSNKPGSLYNAMAPLRELSKFLSKTGYPDTYQIPSKQMPKMVHEAPYFLTEDEIASFFSKCRDIYKEEADTYRRLVVPAIMILLYACGLRPKEARVLPRECVHLCEGYIDVLQSKGPKSRRLFISEELVRYLQKFDCAMNEVSPDRKYFFSNSKGKPYSVAFYQYNYNRIWKKAFPEWVGTAPKLYSFRHHFAWANINKWATEGTDVNAMLPYLMRYMGHNCIKHTLYYFHFVPDFYQNYTDLANKMSDRLPEVRENE